MKKFLITGCTSIVVFLLFVIGIITFIVYKIVTPSKESVRFEKLPHLTGILLTETPLSSPLNCNPCCMVVLSINYNRGKLREKRNIYSDTYFRVAKNLKIKIKDKEYNVIMPYDYSLKVAGNRKKYFPGMTDERFGISKLCDLPLQERLKGISNAVDCLFLPNPCPESGYVDSFTEHYYPLNKEVTLKGEIKGDNVVLLY
ncbi:MAG: hypothetical protein J7604_23080 [Sporocytophaga sp.]|uniref:hypothetical protein n=1 Tax=Sporocytophaga sp. TaxID=2231183 RepID=UPI001B0FBD38|nr:hypothetical protein [Sporocytophaga sp.]MBO9703116.1 hypothetical protein [Sporocytophaga sp.]